MIMLLERLDLGAGLVHRGRLLVTGDVPRALRVRRIGGWTEIDVPALAAAAERLGRSCRVLDEAILDRLAG